MQPALVSHALHAAAMSAIGARGLLHALASTASRGACFGAAAGPSGLGASSCAAAAPVSRAWTLAFSTSTAAASLGNKHGASAGAAASPGAGGAAVPGTGAAATAEGESGLHVSVEPLSGAHEGVSVISLSRPAARNAIGRQLLRELAEALDTVRQERTTRCVLVRSVVSGAGKGVGGRRGFETKPLVDRGQGMVATWHGLKSGFAMSGVSSRDPSGALGTSMSLEQGLPVR